MIVVAYYYNTKSKDNKDSDLNYNSDSEDDYNHTVTKNNKKQKKKVRFSSRGRRQTQNHSSSDEESSGNESESSSAAETPEKVDLQLKVLCLDRSGSMSSFGREVVDGVNTYLSEVHKSHANVRWSVVTFDDIIESPVCNTLLNDSSRLKTSWVTPRGSTSLRDGILHSVTTAQKMIDKSVGEHSYHVEVVVFTDGMENSSSQISQYELQQLITKHRKKGWTFTFLAANQDAIASGTSYGFDAGRSLLSSAGAEHQRSTWKAAASKRKFSKNTRKKCASKKALSKYSK